MKRKIFAIAAIVLVSLFIVSYTFLDGKQKNKVILDAVSGFLRSSHYLAMNIDDTFSEKVYELYLERLDYNKRYLTKSDISQLTKYEHLIDDEVRKGTYNFFDLSLDIIHKRIDKAEDIYAEILKNPFDFSKDESLEFDAEKLEFAQNEEELREIWRKSLKYQVLTKLADKLDVQEKAEAKADTTVKIKSFEELEKECRKEVLKNNDNLFKRIKQIDENDRRAIYLNCITNIYDPHTGYYPPKDKEDFDIQMSGKFEGIGATLSQGPDGYIKVSRIVVGSASWKQGELEVGDIILKVAQGDKEPLDVVDMRLDKAVQFIRGKKGTEVRLTVKKKDATIKIIPIIRDVVILEETFAKSVILKDKKGKHPIGYIYLPKFYVDFKNKKARSCSDDIEKELQKLKNNNVEGVILDLRNNGGGSLQDVVKIVGLFIEKGPVVQVKARLRNKHDVLKDSDPKIQYKGPLTVMVNSFSASASEIFAAAIQDYNRGVIVGSNSTFGKGTVQRFINFDDYVKAPMNNVKPLGAMKMTIQKFYRINGGSTQLKGVTPDIILPDSYSYLKVGEREQDNAMPWDEIKPLSYEKWYDKVNVDKIRKRSASRIAKNETFDLIDENAKRLKKEQDKTVYSLNLKKFRNELKVRKEISKKYENIGKNKTGLEAFTLPEDKKFVDSDTTRITRRNNWIKKLEKDAYLYEAYNILRDIK